MKITALNGFEFAAARMPVDKNLPVLLFISGAGMNFHLWKHQIDELAECAGTVALNLPGHGKSTGPCRESIEDYAAGVLEFIDTIEAKNIVPCGLSMGGAIVLELLINNSDMFPAGIIINSGARLRVMDAIFTGIRQNYRTFLESAGSFVLSGKSDKKTVRPMLEDAMENRWQTSFNDFRACNRFDVTEKLDRIKSPVLILGGADDMLTPLKFSRIMEEKIAGSVLKIVGDAGHVSPLEQPVAVNRHIRNFLESLNF